MKTEAIIFDLGNVFVDVDHARAWRRLRSHGAGSASLDEDAAVAGRLIHDLERGELSTLQFYEALCQHAALSIDLERFCAIYRDMFSPVPEMIEANAALRSRGFPTYIFSNTSELHFTHIRNSYRFMSEFTGYFLSYELGSMKPDACAYHAVEKETGHRGSELLYIDDRLENVDAGAARGWNTIHHTAPRITVASLWEMALL